jgi:hypothetical protein
MPIFGRDVPYFTLEPTVTVPVDPFGGGEFDLGKRLPGPTGLDQLGLEQADRGLHEGIVVGVTNRSDRRVQGSGLRVPPDPSGG